MSILISVLVSLRLSIIQNVDFLLKLKPRQDLCDVSYAQTWYVDDQNQLNHARIII